jgi:hypothetical protein
MWLKSGDMPDNRDCPENRQIITEGCFVENTKVGRKEFFKKVALGTLAVSALLTSESIKLGEAVIGGMGNAQARGNCGSAYECAGGGGQCGSSYECAGGGGKCGSSYECAGGGGKCGSSYNCSGS